MHPHLHTEEVQKSTPPFSKTNITHHFLTTSPHHLRSPHNH